MFSQHSARMTEHILHDTTLGVSSVSYANREVIVSLTSYGKRLGDVAFAIESIMQQTMKPNRIILWLAHQDSNNVPISLKRQQDRGLEIEYCDDLRSYKKIIPTLRKFPQAVIITIDDDAIYDFDLIERLINAYRSAPECIHCARAHRMKLSNTGKLMPYKDWEWTIKEIGRHPMNFLTGGGGTLFPPDSLDAEVLNETVFMDLCPYADDVWLNAMAIKKGTILSRIQTRNPQGEDYISNMGVQEGALWHVNFDQGLNDVQIDAVFTKYGLYEKLRRTQL